MYMGRASENGRISSRAIVAGAGVAGVAGVATALYRTAPGFWKQYARDWGVPWSTAGAAETHPVVRCRHTRRLAGA